MYVPLSVLLHPLVLKAGRELNHSAAVTPVAYWSSSQPQNRQVRAVPSLREDQLPPLKISRLNETCFPYALRCGAASLETPVGVSGRR